MLAHFVVRIEIVSQTAYAEQHYVDDHCWRCRRWNRLDWWVGNTASQWDSISKSIAPPGIGEWGLAGLRRGSASPQSSDGYFPTFGPRREVHRVQRVTWKWPHCSGSFDCHPLGVARRIAPKTMNSIGEDERTEPEYRTVDNIHQSGCESALHSAR